VPNKLVSLALRYAKQGQMSVEEQASGRFYVLKYNANSNDDRMWLSKEQICDLRDVIAEICP
jgi:hypothetical protein